MIGETVNNYRVTELLGEGGMGAVYAAEHPFMGRKAAIKVLRREFAEDVALVERFMNEARAANAIRHPNIIDIIDVGRLPSGIPYLMMEYLEGESLAHRIARGALPVPEAVDIMVQTTAALAAAHAKGIVHRDLKPDNLYLVPDESAPGGIRVKVLDFGIAKLRGDLSGSASKTQAGSLMGTPPYMSPEQCRGVTDEIDHRTDVYAMGIILFEMLCGEPPFMGAGWGDVVIAHMTKPPPSARARNAAIPESIEVVIMKALAKSAGDRFQSASEMRAALRAMAGAPSTFPPRATSVMAASVVTAATPGSKTPTTFRSATGEVGDTLAETPGGVRRKRRGVIIAGVAAVATAGIAAAVLTSGGKPALTARSAAAPVMAPAATAKPAAPMAPAAPREAPAASRILVRLASEPAGALITDAKRGVVIGATPFEQHLDRNAGSLGVRLAKDGYAAVDVDIPLGADFDRTVQLERQRAGAKEKRPSGRSAAAAPAARKTTLAKAAAPAAAPAAPIAPPPVAPSPAKPKADKW